MTEVDIANLALNTLGAERIASLTEPSKNAKAVNLAFPIAASEVMRAHEWALTTSRTRLEESSEENLTTYAYAYYMPSDCLKIVSVANGTEYEVEGNIVYSNIGPDENGGPVVAYIGMTSTRSWPYTLCYLVALFLAYMIAPAVGMDAKAAEMRQRYQIALADTVARAEEGRSADPTLWVDF